MFKHIIIKTFYRLQVPFSNWTRKKRLATFVSIVKPYDGMRILDLGGQPQIWDSVVIPLEITCLNLPGAAQKDHETHHNITYVEGDACDLSQLKPGQFDLVFSNSVIEHVGNQAKRKQFADEVLRISKNYWVQTPSILFPVEPHCGMPFWWFYPESVRAAFLRRNQEKLPAWTKMVRNTTVLRKKELMKLFPGSALKIEWLLFPKSLTVYSIS